MQRPLPQPNFLRGDDTPASRNQLRQLLFSMIDVLNTAIQGVGPGIVAASTITPTSAIHHVTTTAAIDSIDAPPDFTGPLVLIADNGFSYTSGGNISTSGNVSAGDMAIFIFDGETWYPTGANSIAGGSTAMVVTVSTTYPVGPDDTYILADPTGGSFTVTLPAAGVSGDRFIEVKNVGSANTVSVDSADLIDGEGSQILTPANAMAVVCDGSSWAIV